MKQNRIHMNHVGLAWLSWKFCTYVEKTVARLQKSAVEGPRKHDGMRCLVFGLVFDLVAKVIHLFMHNLYQECGCRMNHASLSQHADKEQYAYGL